MILHAMRLAPFLIPAGAFGEMTKFRFYNATVTFGEGAQTRKTVALIKTFIDFAITGNTVNGAGII